MVDVTLVKIDEMAATHDGIARRAGGIAPDHGVRVCR